MASAAQRDFSSTAWPQWTTGSAARTRNGPTASTVSTPILPPKPNRPLMRRSPMPETRAAVDVRSATAVKQLVIERTLQSSPERVFDAFTDPDQLTKWWWPTGFACPAAEVDLRVGGKYRLAMV